MKVQVFKNLIKEAVREVLKEELASLFSRETLSSSFSSKPFNNDVSIQAEGSTPKSLNEVLNLTRQEMTSNDFKNLMNSTGPVVQAPGLETEYSYNQSINENTHNVGIDLSSLDFLNKAKAIYNQTQIKKQ